MPEEHGDWIKRLVADYGFTEDEALIFDHLTEARSIHEDLPNDPLEGTFNAGIRDALNALAFRVVRRDHPNGWQTQGEWEEEEERKAKQELPVWEWFNDGTKGTALIYVNGEHEASAREGETGYFKANPSDRMEVYEMVGYGLDSKPESMELPFLSATVEELARRYEQPAN